jgi:hypothetical protein
MFPPVLLAFRERSWAPHLKLELLQTDDKALYDLNNKQAK